MNTQTVILLVLIICPVIACAITIMNLFFSKRFYKKDQEEILAEMAILSKKLEENTSNLDNIARQNIADLKECFLLNKQQSRNLLACSTFICLLGFLCTGGGIVSSNLNDVEGAITFLAVLAGIIIEVIALIFLVSYNNAIKEMASLSSKIQNAQKLLASLKIANTLSSDKKEVLYSFIAQNMIIN